MAISVMQLGWEANLSHAEIQAMVLGERQRGEVEQRAQWQREAEDIRLAALATTAVPHDPEAIRFTNRMIEAERRGIARWDDRSRDWYLVKAVPAMTSGDSRQTSRRPMTIDDLRRFEKLRPIGPGRWMARCPAHEDRTPSLSIRQTSDRWLFHCHAQGCDFRDIMRAAGLSDVSLRTDS